MKKQGMWEDGGKHGVLGFVECRIRQEHPLRPSSQGSACQGQYPAMSSVHHRSPRKGIRALVL